MSLLSEVIKYGKDLVLLGERVDALMTHRKEATVRVEDNERRLIRIETLIELSQARRGKMPKPCDVGAQSTRPLRDGCTGMARSAEKRRRGGGRVTGERGRICSGRPLAG